MKGDIYSKDFRYGYCDDCGRYVCEQSPSNGWHSQGHYERGEFECNKCYEERTLEEGINEDFNGDSIPGQFYNQSDIDSNGWVQESEQTAGMLHTGSTDPNIAINHIQELINSGKKVLINYGSMAIGGLGGYFTIYTKD